MQRTIHHLPRNPEMQTFCHFLLQKQIMKLNRTHVISNCRFSCSNSCKKWRNLHHFCSNTSQDEDSGPDAWSLAASKVEQYVPYRTSLKIHNRGEESGIGEEVSRVYSGSICRVELSAPISEEIQNQSEESGRGDEISRACSNSVSNVKKSVPKRSSKGIQDQGEGSSSEGENPLGFSGSESKGYLYGSKKRTGKSKIAWVCANCGTSTGQWWGICQSCQEVGTLRQFSEPEIVGSKARGFEASENAVKSWFQRRPAQSQPQSLKEVNKGINPSEWRIPLSGLFGMEVSMVLGGGVVPGSLVLVGGDPGVGKSTLLLQIAAMLAEGCSSSGPAPVIYVSGEEFLNFSDEPVTCWYPFESVEQIGDRADRMKIGTGYLFLYSSTDIEDILQKIQPLSPRALIIDSIQTVYLRGVAGSAGSISQVRECTLALLGFAKQTNLAVFLIGHVTKTGDIAGPRVLEHIVDAVLYMEGERNYSHRLLRSVKNRFGSTDELGVFEMSQLGLQAVSNPGVMFLREHSSDSEILAGCAVAAILDGSRTFLCEVQALCSSVSTVTRHFNGVKDSRADMIISVLMKQAGLKLQGNAIYLNVLSGLKLTETAGDLAIAAAICSSFLEFPIPSDVAFIGEIGLGGELHTVPRMEKRVNELCKLGFKRCVIPKSAQKSLATLSLDGLTLISCRNLKEVINKVFKDEQMQVTNEKTILEAPHLLSGL